MKVRQTSSLIPKAIAVIPLRHLEVKLQFLQIAIVLKDIFSYVRLLL